MGEFLLVIGLLLLIAFWGAVIWFIGYVVYLKIRLLKNAGDFLASKSDKKKARKVLDTVFTAAKIPSNQVKELEDYKL